MRKYSFLFLLIPLFGIGQTKTVITANRVFAKNDKVSEFEQALTSHAQKYHTGDVKWRVWNIESGPDYGGYLITEGPNSWEALDGRGDISAEHTQDWIKNVLPFTEGPGESGFYDFQEDLGTVKITDYADKIIINHATANPGKIGAVRELIKKLQKVWEADSISVAVYSTVASGEPGFIMVTRLKNGLKELSGTFRKPLPDSYNAVYGAGSFETWLKDYADAVKQRWTELLIYKANLSSK
ncbi:hypothetical protein F0L74_08910 [Chitinophaga agrisoli]|uniref:Uncharacterized protein n=1 Tax=Chitinophaga agrisoli TaxID=2607653 RepID=A0A5B2VWF2_9BACT|nr:hypothetical protein [Chitinophaga agrisoli]KAA2242642.1 hypothetical protein F0L74_08910 [Chitinophaga agrisoli]